MRLRSLYIRATNQRMKRTCAVNIFMLCLLSNEVWSNANIKQQRFVRQLNGETAANYEDIAMTNSYHQPHFTGNRSVIVQLFEWKFVDIAAECRDFLGPQGYAGVQLSPVLEHTIVKTAELKHPWWERYEVISYRFGSRSGDESEFWSMSRICNEHGVRIYADVVLNHMAAPLNFVDAATTDNDDFIVNTLLETNVNISQENYSNVPYTQMDFHHPYCMVWDNGQDAHEIRNCQLSGHPDLDHSRGNVQKHIVQMLNKFIDMGVAGFRIDTAKYIWPIDLKNILKQVKNLSTEFNFKRNARPFVYHDVFDLGLDTVSKTEYSSYGLVSEYLYPAELSTIFKRKVSLSSLINWGPALGFLPHEDSLVFIDSHDTQRGLPASLGNNQMLTYKERIKYIMANIFMLVHPYGAIKRIMSSYYFTDKNINQGPPREEANEDEIRSPKYTKHKQCTKESGWVCEHRWQELVNMLKVANYFKQPGNKEDSVIFFQTNGANQMAFCRGYKAFVAINNDPVMDFIKDVYACLEPGIYCDVVTGGKKEGKEECHGKILEINEKGFMKLELSVADDGLGNDEEEIEMEPGEEEGGKISNYGVIVIYVDSKIAPANNNEAEATGFKDNEEYAGIEENQSIPNEDSGMETKGTEVADEDTKEVGEGYDQEDNEESAGADKNQLTASEDNDGMETGETTNADDYHGGDRNQSTGNADAVGDDQKDAEAEVQEETKIELTAENDDEQKVAEDEDTDGDEYNSKQDTKVDNNEEDGEPDGKQKSASGEIALEDTDGDENQSKGSAKDDEQENVKEETGIEQPEQHDSDQTSGEAVEEDIEVDKSVPAESISDEAVNKPPEEISSSEGDKEDEKPQENIEDESHADTEQEKTADDSSEETFSNEKEEKGDVEHEVSLENENLDSNAETNVEEQDNKTEEENSDNKENTGDAEETPKDAKEKSIPDELPKEEQEDQEAEAVEQEKEQASESPNDAGNNQSRNLDERSTEAEAQIEKPSAEIVDETDEATNAVTAKIQDIQTAGFISNPKSNNNNG